MTMIAMMMMMTKTTVTMMFLVVMSQGELVDVVDYAQRDIEAAFHQHPASKFFPLGFLKMSQSHEQSERLVSLEHLSWSHKFFGYDICEDSPNWTKLAF